MADPASSDPAWESIEDAVDAALLGHEVERYFAGFDEDAAYDEAFLEITGDMGGTSDEGGATS